jgi:dienelactone hydrolase
MITITNDFLEGIPFTTYQKADGKRKPLIFFFHGFSGDRTIGIMGRGEMLAELGFYVVALDAYLHGERKLALFDQLTYSEKQKDTFNITMHTAKDAKRLYEKYFQYDESVHPGAVYAYGVSLGAAVTFYLASIMKELKTFISIVGSPSMVDFYQYKQVQYNWDQDQYFTLNLESYKSECPLLNYKRLENKNIFMGCGDHDTTVPPKYAQELTKKLNSPNVVCQFYDCAHTSTPTMQEDANVFLMAHL